MNAARSSLVRQLMLHPTWMRVAALALALVVGLVLQAVAPGYLQQLDERSDSLSWRLVDGAQQERRVVVVDIDEKSVQALGPWPWSRDTLARLVDGLNHYQVGLKLYDIVLPDLKPGDAQLQHALAQGGPNVWGQVFSLNPDVDIRQGQPLGGLDMGPCPSIAAPAHGHVANHAGLLGASASAGHITPIIDPDGAVRHVPALVCWQGQSYPSLVLAGLLAGSNDNQFQIVRGQGLLDPAWRLNLRSQPDMAVPLNEQGQMRVSYQLPRSGFVSVSAIDVIDHKAPAALLQGVWALVGSTAFGVGDAVATPQGGAVGGLEVHAQMLAAALDGRTPYAPQGHWLWKTLSLALAAVLLLATAAVGERSTPAISSRRLPGLLLPLLGLLLSGLFFAVHAWALLRAHLWLGWVLPSIIVVLAALLLSAAELVRLRWEKTRLFDNLSSYLSAPVAREIGLSERTADIQAERRDVYVMCAGLRNFAAFSERQSPDAAAQVLHQFVSVADRIIQTHGGALQHVHGADLLAVWPGQTPAASMLSVARQLWQATEDLCAQWQPDASLQAPDHQPLLELGLGLERGTAWVGSLGPSERRVHTLLGEPVQVARALQDMTVELAYPVLLGPQLVDGLPASNDLLRLGQFLLPGTAAARVLHAVVVEYNVMRLRLIVGDNDQQRVA